MDIYNTGSRCPINHNNVAGLSGRGRMRKETAVDKKVCPMDHPDSNQGPFE